MSLTTPIPNWAHGVSALRILSLGYAAMVPASWYKPPPVLVKDSNLHVFNSRSKRTGSFWNLWLLWTMELGWVGSESQEFSIPELFQMWMVGCNDFFDIHGSLNLTFHSCPDDQKAHSSMLPWSKFPVDWTCFIPESCSTHVSWSNPRVC